MAKKTKAAAVEADEGEAKEPKGKKKAAAKKAPAKPRKAAPKAPSPLQVSEMTTGAAQTALAEAVVKDGGAVLCQYREPYGGHAVLLVALPADKVEPTPYQRDVSPAHVKKLARSIEKVGRFLDPVLAVRHEGKYQVANGGHRLAALKAAGGASITALLVPEPEVAHKILALNTEKAHNLKERALEVVRLLRILGAAGDARQEKDLDVELEEGALVTLGAAYEKRKGLSGGAYSSMLKRVDALGATGLKEALARREALADRLLAIDDRVTEIVERLKERGLKGAFLRAFVVARLNPLGKFASSTGAPTTAEDALTQLAANAKSFDPESVKEQDLAAAAGPAPSEGEGDE